MNFFEHQDRATKKTWLLHVYFSILLVIFSALITVAILVSFPQAFCSGVWRDTWQMFFSHTQHCTNGMSFLPVVIIFFFNILIVSLVAWYKKNQLNRGGISIAENFDGRLLTSSGDDPLRNKAQNVIEEMAIAAGCPVPTVYEIQSTAINAFVAGTKPGNVVLALTSGAIENLNRDELQAVVAHEFSHIYNQDMKINMDMHALSHGILFFYEMGRSLLRSSKSSSSRRSRSKGGGQLALMGLCFLIIGSIGYFFSLLLKAATSRQREFLADATAVQYTRNPKSLADAFGKAIHQGTIVEQPASESVSHMFLLQGSNRWLKSFYSGWMSTHPPIEERIQRLGFRPFHYIDKNIGVERVSPSKEQASSGFMPSQTGVVGAIHATKENILEHKELVDKIHNPYESRAVILSMLVHQDEQHKLDKLKFVRSKLGDEIAKVCEEHILMTDGFSNKKRLQIIDISLPGLRQLSRIQLIEFLVCVKEIIYLDKHIDIFEYCLYAILRGYLKDLLPIKYQSPTKPVDPNMVKAWMASVLTTISSKQSEYQSVYNAALKEFAVPIARRVQLLSWNAVDFDQAITQASNWSVQKRKQLIDSSIRILLADSRANDSELEILRCLCIRLDFEMPPINTLVALNRNQSAS